LNGRNFITANTLVLSRPPEAANTFISPRVRNDVVDDIKSEDLLSFDVNYLAKYQTFKMRFTLYSSQINNQTWLRSYWHDEFNNTVNVIMTNVNTKHSGIELGIEKTIYLKHVFQYVLGFAQSLYTDQPKLQAWQDNNNTSLYFNRKVYLKNYRLGNSPQFISSIAYKFTGKKNWFVGACLNYVDQIYIAANPDRRTAEAAGKFQENEKELAEVVTAQERLPAYFLLNANAGKSFRFHKKQYLNLNFSVNNLLNNTQIISTGYEQLRWNQQQIEQFPNKYYYMTGITYMLLLNFSF
jgi:outer membrane receptor for Fe3+-dicitrate